MTESLVTRFGAPDVSYCDPDKVLKIIIPAPLEYSICYMKGTKRGPQALLDASDLMGIAELGPMPKLTCGDNRATKLVYQIIGYRFANEQH